MLQIIIDIVIFLIIFCVLVVSHEGGHFLIAKANGISVSEFTIGMGPCLYQKQIGETMFSIRLLPVGGACIFDDSYYSDDDDESDNDKQSDDEDDYDTNGSTIKVFMKEVKDAISDENEDEDEHSFKNANVWARIATLFAGPFANFILGYLLSVIIVSFSYWNFPLVTGFSMADSPAEQAGLETGDLITSINGHSIHQSAEVSFYMYLTDGEDVEVTYERDGQSYTTTITPTEYIDEDSGTSTYIIGIYIGKSAKVTGISTLKYAAYNIEYYFTSTIKAIELLVQGGTDKVEISGPVGMIEMVDNSYTGAKNSGGYASVILTMINLAMFLSINLGIMNLLPFPALDGGRLVFCFIEVIIGKSVPREKEAMIEFLGALALIIIMIVVMFHDISKMF